MNLSQANVGDFVWAAIGPARIDPASRLAAGRTADLSEWSGRVTSVPSRTPDNRDGRDVPEGVTGGESAAQISVQSAGTGAQRHGERTRARRLQQGLLAPRLRRESGGVTPTAQMTRMTGRKRAEVQGSAPFIEGGGRLPTNSSYAVRLTSGRSSTRVHTVDPRDLPDHGPVWTQERGSGLREGKPGIFSSGERTDEALAREAALATSAWESEIISNVPRHRSQAGMGSERSSLTRFNSDGPTSRPEAVAKSAAHIDTPATAKTSAQAHAYPACAGGMQDRVRFGAGLPDRCESIPPLILLPSKKDGEKK